MEMAVLEIKVSFQTLPHSEFFTWSEWYAPLPLQSELLYDFVSQKAKLFGPENHLLKSTTERCPTGYCLKSFGVVFLTFQKVYLTEFAYGKAASGFLCFEPKCKNLGVNLAPQPRPLSCLLCLKCWKGRILEPESWGTLGSYDALAIYSTENSFPLLLRATHPALASPSSL